ncbi:MAG: glycosyl transferase group 1 [Polyangiaceae bacterium]|jgi:glycosyltransferase involved in cell wall biosynthesis|nr:glycosyl transferase group 1 [Polyangiaceae bacterium]
MRCLILAAGRFDETLRSNISNDQEPRLDVFELQRELNATVLDFKDADASRHPAVRLAARAGGPSAGVAMLGFLKRRDYDCFFTTGEDIGLPLAALLRATPGKWSHTMIAHTLFPAKKRAFFKIGVARELDRVLVYSTSEERLAVDELGLPASKVQRIYYHADQQFFRPHAAPPQPDLLCAAGQLLRDYECLVEAVRDLKVRVEIAAGSPWIERKLEPQSPLPPNVSWGKLNRFELRALYARSALAVVPIKQNHYQTGIATILEMMAMGKCVIATKTHGQTDTIVDGVTGVYVPPGDSQALGRAITQLLQDPSKAAELGAAARRFIEENAGLDLFVRKVTDAVKAGHAARFSS